ncbi:MAG: 1,4-dihydroxy-2-naphthoate polyprenyltransferase [Dehalococcoidia bacterium]|nr:1,4-dihydroxy-2-naphthoate polyprenyltransferase [Dehalococcoidia bacterium]
MTAAVGAAPISKLRAWRLAARVPTLSASVAPVAVGTGVAIRYDSFELLPALAALFAALCLQVGANLANDVFDFRKGADTVERLGPPRAVQMGMLSEREVVAGMWLVFAMAAVAGIYLAYAGGWPIIIAGLACIGGAIVYTGGPWPIGYHGLGDLFTFVFFGFVAVPGTVFVQAEAIPDFAWVAAIPVGATVTSILVVNNLRDIATDRRAGKRTLGVAMGDLWTRRWYGFLVGTAFVVALAAWPLGPLGWPVLLVLGALLPLAKAARPVVDGTTGRALNASLKATANFNLVFGLLFALGIATS